LRKRRDLPAGTVTFLLTDVKLLVTSRERLRIRGEVESPVPP